MRKSANYSLRQRYSQPRIFTGVCHTHAAFSKRIRQFTVKFTLPSTYYTSRMAAEALQQ